MDDVFSNQTDSIMQLASELKNVNLSLDDIKKELNKSDSKLTEEIAATKVDPSIFKNEKKEETTMSVPVPAPAIEKNDYEQAMSSIEVVDKDADNVTNDNFLKEKEIQPADTTDKINPNVVYEAAVSPNQGTKINNTVAESTQDTPSAIVPIVPVVAPVLPVDVPLNLPESKQPEPSNNNEMSQLETIEPVRKIEATERPEQNVVAESKELPPATNNIISNEGFNSTNKTANVNIFNKNVVVAEEAGVVPVAPQPVNTTKNIFVEVPAPSISEISPAKNELQIPVSLSRSNTNTEQISNNTVAESSPFAKETKPEPKLPVQNIQTQQEQEIPAATNPAELQIVAETERVPVPVSTKDSSLINMEKSMNALVINLNKNLTQIATQLTELNNISMEILKTLPGLASQPANSASAFALNRQASNVTPNAINDFRNLTSKMFAQSRQDNMPTLT